jgi:hypothetical protein
MMQKVTIQSKVFVFSVFGLQDAFLGPNPSPYYGTGLPIKLFVPQKRATAGDQLGDFDVY